ncbi:hypothetical protein HUU53_00585 [Candidatus Micrarchaeota archaeon]|nr:hypothetical protein [Candidatus Micrarchaeota archaeon]
MKKVFLIAVLLVSVFVLGHGNEEHGVFEAPVQPTIQLMVTQDFNGGWNLHLITSNFIFAPENAGGQNFAGQGHAHLYVDGEKIARIYSDWYYLPPLSEGKHELTVTLNTNDHSDYYFEGKPVQSSLLVIETKPTSDSTSGIVLSQDDASFAVSHLISLGIGLVIGLSIAFYFLKKSGE